MMSITAKSVALAPAKMSTRSSLKRSTRRSIAVRANLEEPTQEAAPVVEQTVVVPPPVTPAAAPVAPKTPGFGDVMAFDAAPERINSRLAMLAFVAALGAELSSGESVFQQIGDAPVAIGATFLIFSIASIVPVLKNAKLEAFGPFTPNAELTNGRAAMLGFVSLLVVEALRHGTALF